MKKRLFRLIAILSVILATSSCEIPVNPGDPIGYTTRNNRVNAFYLTDSIHIEQAEGSVLAIVYCSHNSESVLYDFNQKRYQPQAPLDNQEIFNAYCSRHNDTSFNKECLFFENAHPDELVYNSNVYIGFDIESISIISDADFDAAHPSGTPLNDIIRFEGLSIMPYINSGYVQEFNWDSCLTTNSLAELLYQQISADDEWECATHSQYHLIEKPLSQCTTEDFMLLGGGGKTFNFQHENKAFGMLGAYLVFTSLPTEASTHHITITFNGVNGVTSQSFTSECDVTF